MKHKNVKNGLYGWSPKGDGKLIYDFLPENNSLQTNSLREGLAALERISPKDGRIIVVDLGCGSGESYDIFSARAGVVHWVGLDITDSQEASAQKRTKMPFCAYDGVCIPLATNSVDIIYSRQVFEHVRRPEALLTQVHRVLKTGGVFVGSTSHLEPFHSRSYWNYTPYGFCVLLGDAGFHSIQVRPGIDALTLIARRYFSYVKLAGCFEPFFKMESPMNVLLETALRLLCQPVKRRNAFKLLFAGQFCFRAQK